MKMDMDAKHVHMDADHALIKDNRIVSIALEDLTEPLIK